MFFGQVNPAQIMKKQIPNHSNFLKGQQPSRFYICSGLDPNKNKVLTKVHYLKYIIRYGSLIIHICLGVRIQMFKSIGQRSISHAKNFLGNTSLTDLTISCVAVGMFVAALIPSALVDEIPHGNFNTFPNYAYVYFLQIFVPSILCLSVFTLYFIRNPNIRSSLEAKIYTVRL